VPSTPPHRFSAAPPAQSAPEDPTPIHVLVVDDEPGVRRSLARILGAKGFHVETAEDGKEALAYIQRNRPDVVLLDMMMPGLAGLEVLAKSKQIFADVEIIMMTAFADVDSAVAAVKAGAYDFLTKPFPSNDAVAISVAKAAERKRLVARAARLQEELLSRERFGEIIGNSPKMQAVYRLIEGVAAATSTILILGESGTGKELVARAIHQASQRSAKPFVPVNCAAIPKDLVESELFGHVRGAFTGAQTARAGLFESANGGTIFLDEVGDLPLAAQVKLLRTLQEGEIKRVGSDEVKYVDVRVLAATNVDLLEKIEKGDFRKDLYYRLNVIAINMPSLNEREDDVIILANFFVQKLATRMGRDPKTLSGDAVRALRGHTWPGNVRELEHAIEHAFVLSQGAQITARDLPFRVVESVWPPAADGDTTSIPPPPLAPDESEESLAQELHDLAYPDAKRIALARFDVAYVREALRRSGGNVSAAARRAGLDRSNFRRILRKCKAG
jgi:DNA-binding NtrC family response regulator